MEVDLVYGIGVDPKNATGQSEYREKTYTSVRWAASRRLTKSRSVMSTRTIHRKLPNRHVSNRLAPVFLPAGPHLLPVLWGSNLRKRPYDHTKY